MVLVLGVVLLLSVWENRFYGEIKEELLVTEPQKVGELRVGVFGEFDKSIHQADVIEEGLAFSYLTPEQQAENIYTFLQGPKSWTEGRPWSGEWCYLTVKKNAFGNFGCGLCCMANIYSSLSPYECSPVDMFEYASQVTGYYPTKESGAIGWLDMKTALQASGFACDVYNKPVSYEEFQEQMKVTKSAIVLVSSVNSDAFWKDTPGHYVNIWLYQPQTDMVFLAEPGDPLNNRTWIPLRYVYDALKTVSQYQYLAVTSYGEEQNQWKWNGIDDNWMGK